MRTVSETDLNHILDHTRDAWDELRGQRMFVTGGTGFFGTWLLESIVWANDRLNLQMRVEVLTRDPGMYSNKAPALARHECIRLIKGDIRDYAFPSGSFSHVIHAAAESGTSLNEENPREMIETIIDGTNRTLDFAQSSGAQKLLFISSGAIYGRQPVDMASMSEGYSGGPDPIDPHSAYAEGKRAAELSCALRIGEGLDTKIARCFAFVGPHLPLDGHFAIGNFIRDGLRGGPIIVKGDGSPVRSYLYAADLSIWLLTILIRGKSGAAYNVGSEEAITIGQLADKVSKAFPNRPPVQIMTPLNAGRRIERYVPSTRFAETELGLHAWINLEEGIKRTLSFLVDQGK
jgi:dTDP-glucose 4,6-dehydratase